MDIVTLGIIGSISSIVCATLGIAIGIRLERANWNRFIVTGRIPKPHG